MLPLTVGHPTFGEIAQQGHRARRRSHRTRTDDVTTRNDTKCSTSDRAQANSPPLPSSFWSRVWSQLHAVRVTGEVVARDTCRDTSSHPLFSSLSWASKPSTKVGRLHT